jgi:ribosomal protein S4
MSKQKIISKYKTSYKYRCNLFGDSKVYTKLKKKKWKRIFLVTRLIFRYARKKINIKKQNAISKKKFFKVQLLEKQKFKSFYGFMLDKKFKQIYAKSKANNLLFYNTLESRLDVVLLRSNLLTNMTICQYYIKTGKILVNNKIITNTNYILQRGDIIDFFFNRKIKKLLIKKYIFRFNYFLRYKKNVILDFFFPRTLIINPSTFRIIYLFKYKKLNHIFYPIFFNLKVIQRAFNK